MIDVTSLLKVWRPGEWQARIGVSPLKPTFGVWWSEDGEHHVGATLAEDGRWSAELQRDGEYVVSGFGDTLEAAVLGMIQQDAYRQGVEDAPRHAAFEGAGETGDTMLEAGAARVPGLRPAAAVAAEVRAATTDTEQEAARAFQEQFEDALTRRGDKTELHLHVQDRFLGVARRMLDEAGYAYEVLTKGGLGQLRDGGTTTPVIINLIEPRGV